MPVHAAEPLLCLEVSEDLRGTEVRFYGRQRLLTNTPPPVDADDGDDEEVFDSNTFAPGTFLSFNSPKACASRPACA